MDFWSDHNVMFVIGLVVCPRLMLLFYGLVPAQSVSSILGFLFVPRMFLTSILTTSYGNTNSSLIVVCWILAVVCDVAGIIFKIAMHGAFMQAQKEAFQRRF